MAFRIRFSEQAAQDLSDIVEYISNVLCNLGAAERFYNDVNKKLNNISGNPFMYPLTRYEKLSAEGYRVAVIGNYHLFYLVYEAESIAFIVRIIYGKRDVTAIFK